MNKTTRAYLELHIAVFLFGFTAILGDLISLSAPILVWWRVLITSISLFILIRFGKTLKELPRSLILQFMGIGVLVGLHWITFFGSIKFSNASICLVCMATASFFTSILEPLITKKRMKGYEIILGLLIIPGMYLVVQSTGWSMILGIGMGLTSAFLAAVFAILNKQRVMKADSLTITFIELSSAWLFICLLLPIIFYANPDTSFMPVKMDWPYLLVLSLLCTTLAYVLALRSLKYISAFASNLTINLEPVYGIILAWFILNDGNELKPGFYFGGLIIILSVLCYPFLRNYFEKVKS